MKRLFFFILSSFISIALVQNPVEVKLDIYVVAPNGELIPALAARNGQTVQYVLTARNNSPTTLTSGTVVITGHIPNGVTYIPGSAIQRDMVDLEETPTSVKWTINKPMEPNEEIQLSYQVLVGAYASNPNQNTVDEIMANCRTKWGNNTDMVDYCVRNQRQANTEINRFSGLVRSNCEAEWGTNYEMVLYCIKNQTQAQETLQSVPNDEILQYCQQEWGTNYEMVEYCVRNQTKARTTVNSAPKDEITDFCTREWGTNYEMVEYCMKNQRAAKQNVLQNYTNTQRRACENQWGVNYVMIEYCLRNQ